MPVAVVSVDEVVNASVIVAVAIDSETYVVDAMGCEDGFALVQPQSNTIQAKHRHSLRIFMGILLSATNNKSDPSIEQRIGF